MTWTWQRSLVEGYFYDKEAFLFPTILVMGVALILFPGYREERLSRGEDISQLQGMQLLTPRWWAILVVCFIAGAANYFALKGR